MPVTTSLPAFSGRLSPQSTAFYGMVFPISGAKEILRRESMRIS